MYIKLDSSVFWLLLFAPFIYAIFNVITKSLFDWILNEGVYKKEIQEIIKPNRKVAVVWALAGLACWYFGDQTNNYNLFLVVLGYILFFVAYKKYRGSK